MEKESKQFAVLIDADNAQASVLESILNEISLMGDATVKRIYDDERRCAVTGTGKSLSYPLAGDRAVPADVCPGNRERHELALPPVERSGMVRSVCRCAERRCERHLSLAD